MAVPAEKIKARLKALYPKANLSKARLDAFADKLAAKPADDATDEQVDEVINDYNEIINFEEVAKQDDKVRTLEARKSSTTPPKKEQEEEVIKPDDDAPSWAKALLQKVESLESNQKAKTISEKFNSDERVKSIPEFIRKGYIPKSDDDFEEKITELTEAYKPFAEKHKIQSIAKDTPLNGDGGSTAKVKKLSEEDAKRIVESM